MPLRIIPAALIFILCVSFSLDDKSGPAHETVQFPAQLDSNYFSKDTVSFSRFDKKPLTVLQRLALLRAAIRESGVLKTYPAAFLQRNFNDSNSLATYENATIDSNSQFVQGDGRAEIFVFDFNGDSIDDLVLRYSNGADDNASFFFAKREGKYKHIGHVGGYVNEIVYENGKIVSLRYVGLACCDYPYDTFYEVELLNDSLAKKFSLCIAKRTQTRSPLAFIRTTQTTRETYMQPVTRRNTDRSFHFNGTIKLAPNTTLGVYEEKIVDDKTWLRVMRYDSAHRCTYIMGWVEKSDTNY